MLRILIYALLMHLLLTSCEPLAEDAQVRHFVIRKGDHYSSPRYAETLQANKLVFEATFDATAKYTFDEYYQDSTNKLLGFSDCNSEHHENSARFGWMWFNDQLEIHAYCYINGVRHTQFIGIATLNEPGRYEIEVKDTDYIFRFNDNIPVVMPRGNTCDKGVYYMLWPYFGGTMPAPHDVHVAVRMLH
jgi:hypothetical protein